MFKAYIFDLDGTLADTVESIAYVANTVLGEFGYRPLPTEKFYNYCGEGGRKLMERCLRDCKDDQLAHLDEGERRYTEVFAQNPLYRVVPYEGMIETLDALKRRDIRLAVCTNKPHQAAVETVEGIFGRGYFDGIQGSAILCAENRLQTAHWLWRDFLECLLRNASMWGTLGQICRLERQLECILWEYCGGFEPGRNWKKIMQTGLSPIRKNC